MAAERPRILYLGPGVPGGMSTAMQALLASPLGERYRIEFVPTHRGDGAARRLAVFAAALCRLAVWSIRRRGLIVHVHSTVRGSLYRKAICVLVAKALRRRVVLQLHSGPGDIATFAAGLGRPAAGLLRLAFGHADIVLAVSNASAAALRSGLGATDVEVIPNPAPPVPAETPSRDGEQDPLAIFLGGFANHVKGGENLLAALELPELETTRFLLAGPGEPPERCLLLVETRPTLEWRGWLQAGEKDEVLRRAEIFVLPSTSEGLPMALLEAMAYGLAVVATDVGGVPDVAHDGIDALIVPAEDPPALAAAVARLAADPALRRRLGDAARAEAIELGADRVAERFDSIYRELLGRSGQKVPA